MKRLMIAGVITLLLSGVSVQAESTISWGFDTVGDAEGWYPVPDSLNSLTNGIEVVDGFDSVVLTSPDVTGNDAGIYIITNLTLAAGEFWDTIEIRSRTLDGNAGSPVPYNNYGTVMVLNGAVIGPIGDPSSGWTNTVEPGEWLVTSYNVSGLVGTNDITDLRLDVPFGTEAGNFEYDYIKIHTTTTEPPRVQGLFFDFDTLGDTENWTGHLKEGLTVAKAVSGGDVVLTCADIIGDDSSINWEGAFSAGTQYWEDVEIRVRLLDGNSGNPIPWIGGDLMHNYSSVTGWKTIPSVGGAGWDSKVEDEGEWITASYDLSTYGQGSIYIIRFDFTWNDTENFEVDYIHFNLRETPAIPNTSVLVHEWEFNTFGDVEGFTDNGDIVNLTVDHAISGSEVVLTSENIVGEGDSQLFWNGSITPLGVWETMELRMRQLSDNPGALGVIALDPCDTNQLVVIANATGLHYYGMLVSKVLSSTQESNGWTTVVLDLSDIGTDPLSSIRLDTVGDTNRNFEVDYIRVNSGGTPYLTWTSSYGLSGSNALEVSDPDGDAYTNLYEYAFGGNPTNSLDFGYISSELVEDGGTNYLEYVYARRHGFNQGVNYSIQLTDDLTGSWTNSGETVEVGSFEYNNAYEIVTNRTVVARDINTYIRVSAKSSNYMVYSGITEVTAFDGWAVSYGLYGENSEPTADPDVDGLSNQEEFKLGTNPTNDDSDGDLLSDFEEVNNIVAWGDNSYGQTLVSSNAVNVVKIAASEAHSLALLADGMVVAWGDNSNQQCDVPSSITNALSIAAGGSHSLAVLSNGTVVAWGNDSHQQSTVPGFATNIVNVSAGIEHSTALQGTGRVVVWGNNYYGVRDVPPSVTNAIQIAAGGYHNLALLADGTVKAWGDNANGACNVPGQVTNAVAVAAGGYHSMAILSDGRLVAWGKDDYGQSTIPAAVSNAVAVAAGGYHNLAMLADGSIETWGNSSYDLDLIPSRVQYPIAISAGRFFSLALLNPTDPLDPDTDGDGLNDGDEVNTFSTDPLNEDSDDDGLSDGQEVSAGLDPLVSNVGLDTDSDGLLDIDEVNTYSTDPLNPDSDNDGLEDGEELVTYGTDPLDEDTDDDTFGDGEEVMHGGLPLVSDFWHVDKIRNNGSVYDLYPSNSVLDLAIGQAGFEVIGGEAWLSLQLEESTDLIIWTNAGDEAIWSIPVDQSNAFYRVRSGH